MAITKTFLKTRASCKVKFRMEPDMTDGAAELFLVGDFNSWQDTASPMKKLRDGSFSLEVELPLGQDYQFRYRTDGNVWLNDPEADAYVPCAFSGAENFVVKV